MKQKRIETFKKYIPLTILLVIFVVLAFVPINRSIWFDESYTANLVDGSYSDIWYLTGLDVHPPLYYWCLRTWSLIFGRSIIALRSFTIFCSVIALTCAYFLFKRWSKSEKTSIILTAAMAICPFFIYYSTEMRMYGMSCAVILGSTLALDYALREKKRKYWLLYSITIALGLYTHYFIAFAFLAQFIYIVFYFKQHGADIKNLILCYLLALVLYIPWIPTLISQVLNVEAGFWIPDVSANTVVSFFSFSLMNIEDIGALDQLIPFLIALLFISISFITTLKYIGHESGEKLLLLGLLVFIPPAGLFALSIIPSLEPLFVHRYVTCSIALFWPFVVTFILVLARYKKILAYTTAVVMLVCSAIGIYLTYDWTTKDRSVELKFSEYIRDYDDTETDIVVESYSYDFIFYASENHKIKTINVNEQFGSSVPIIAYKKNYVADFEEYKKSVDRFWYLVPVYDKEIDAKKTAGKDFKIADSVIFEDRTMYLFVRTKNLENK